MDENDSFALELLDDRASTRLDRREFLTFIGASLAATACGEAADGSPGSRTWASISDDPTESQPNAPRAPRLEANPFEMGVASGDPTHESVILWTRLTPEPTEAGAMPARDVPVRWAIAEGDEFDDEKIVGRGWLRAEPALGHSVHVDVRGLEPNTEYAYKFWVGDQFTSPEGRTRTLPAPDASPDAFKVATACCQNYRDGYYTAHHHLAREEDLDAVFFLGDYIYEAGFGGNVRSHTTPKPTTLEEFRRRYGLYKKEPQLKEAHAHAPWIVTWDDHEVRNNYAGDEPKQGHLSRRDLKEIRAAAYQAYYEHMPLRVPFTPHSDRLRIHRSFQVGDLVSFFVLDGRQYRSGIICTGDVEEPCDEATSPAETMLGDEQRRWLARSIKESSTRWNAVAQQTVFTPVNFENSIINPDMWDGYQWERQRLLDLFASDAADAITVLTGDIHAAGFSELPRDDDRPAASETVGHEIITTSISSGNSILGDTGELGSIVEDQFDYVRHFEPTSRGYTVVTYRRDRCEVRYRTVSTVEEETAELSTDQAFDIDRESGDVENVDAS